MIASGKLITPSEVAWALCCDADFVTSARGFMLTLGCIQTLKCNKNTCLTGITTHDKYLQRGLDPGDKAIRVKDFEDNSLWHRPYRALLWRTTPSGTETRSLSYCATKWQIDISG